MNPNSLSEKGRQSVSSSSRNMIFNQSRQGGQRLLEKHQTAEMADLIVAHNIEDIQKLYHVLDNKDIEEFLLWRQSNPYGNLYDFWVNVPASEADRHNLRTAGGLKFHVDLANLILDKLVIYQGHVMSRGCRLEAKNHAFSQTLEGYCQSLSDKFKAIQSNLQQGLAFSEQLFKFQGLNIKDREGKLHDLSRQMVYIKVNFINSNIHVANPLFVTHFTEKFLQTEHDDMSFHNKLYRIYLNPQIHETISLADQLIHQCENQQLVVATKILNRGTEMSNNFITDIRSEGLMLYVATQDINQVLGLVLKLYKSHKEAFKHRLTPKLAVRIAPGIAVATEAGFDSKKYSFNRHRVNILDEAWQSFKALQTCSQMGSMCLGEGDLRTFRQLFNEACTRFNVDTHNIAFTTIEEDLQ